MSYKCKVCGQVFDEEKQLHMHLRSHKLMLSEYYLKYYPRKNLYTGEPLPFKNKEQYFSKDFSHRQQLLSWCKENDAQTVKEYIIKLLQNKYKKRI